jgi:DNA mismatch endonuclease (patch repair protein)
LKLTKPRKRNKTTRPEASSPDIRYRMQVTPRRDTPCELAVRRAVHRLGVRFRVDRSVLGTRRRADLVFPRARVAVFVDGCFWHGCPVHGTWPKANAAWWRDKICGNVRRDRDTDAELAAAGWLVLRFWEHDRPTEAGARIVAVIRARLRRAR